MVYGSEITARNHWSLAIFHRTLKLHCGIALSCLGRRCPWWASQPQIAKNRCGQRGKDMMACCRTLSWITKAWTLVCRNREEAASGIKWNQAVQLGQFWNEGGHGIGVRTLHRGGRLRLSSVKVGGGARCTEEHNLTTMNQWTFSFEPSENCFWWVQMRESLGIWKRV